MINPRYASIGFVLVAITLFVWVGATNSNKDGTGTAEDVSHGPKGVIASQPISMRVDSGDDASLRVDESCDSRSSTRASSSLLVGEGQAPIQGHGELSSSSVSP